MKFVDFDAHGFANDGAKEVGPITSRFVTPVLKAQWPQDPPSLAAAASKVVAQGMFEKGARRLWAWVGREEGGEGEAPRLPRRRLVVSRDGRELELVKV